MTLSEMLSNLYDDLGFDSTPAPSVVRRLTANLNKAQRAILREPGLLRLRDTLTPLTFTSESGRYIYGLPASLARITAITERDNDRDLDEMSIPELRLTDPGFTATGPPYAYIPLSYRQIENVPASTGLWAVSSSASDTTQAVYIDGVRASGLATGTVNATLTGLTRVAIGTITDYVDVKTVSISSTAVGIVTIYDAASAGNIIARIPVGAISPQYFCVQLYPTPASEITYYVDGSLRLTTMTIASDTPIIPEEFHDMLPAYARMREYEKTDDMERRALAAAEYDLGMTRLKHYVSSQPAEIPVMGRRVMRRYSRFGPWAPAGSGWR